MQYYPFDSRNSIYREKIGALAEGETLRLRLLLHRDACVHEAFFVIKNDSEESSKELLMQAGDWIEDYLIYECEMNLSEGLYWYHFRYTSDYGEMYVTKTETSLGIVSKEGKSWQQTVYAKNFKTPDWLAGGIIYQIFPDRFYNSGTKKENVPKDRFICNDWGKPPEFRQPEDICRLGNDYYGGDLKGIEEKLDYLSELGVSCIYLNPIFEAHSNHRYNTADYLKIDPILGTEKDLESLVKAAEKKGIAIILDGVFSHTGDDSVYFNKKGRYSSLGAYQSKESPYYDWFKFESFPHKYESWWGIKTLPETNENDPSYTEFVTGENGIIRYWLKKGIKGWRLDVADELPDEFLEKLRTSLKAENGNNYLLGEVWEDASNKISYGARRKFLRGKQLDSVMNYPFAEAIINFVRGGDAALLSNTVLDICENYPPEATKLLMNHIGTHDTERILTRLGRDDYYEPDREKQAVTELSPEQYSNAVNLLKLAAVLQYTLPGVPSLYYGDEAGLTGYGDPFCRKGYPWGKGNAELLEFYKALGKMRRENTVFKKGEFVPVSVAGGLMAYLRREGDCVTLIAVNREKAEKELILPDCILGGKCVFGENIKGNKIILPPLGYSVIAK